MFCPRCGKPIPNGAAFCPACGTAIAAAPPKPAAPRPADTARQNSPAARQMPPAGLAGNPPRPATNPSVPMTSGMPAGNLAADLDAQRKKNRMAMAGVAVAALVAAFFGLRAAGLLGLNAGSPKPALQVRSETPSPALALPGNAGPAPIQVAAEKKQMPADVEAWLKHLEECEKRKVRISGDQMAEAMVLMQKMQALGAGMGLMDPYDQSSDNEKDQDPGTYTKGKMMDFRPQWDELIAFFNSKAPPEECKPLAADFNRALSEIPGMMGDIGQILNDVTSNPQAALQNVQKFKGSSYGDIDRYFQRADVKLGEICQKYEKTKWFNIKADVQGGSPLSAFGNLGGVSGALGGASGTVPGVGQ